MSVLRETPLTDALQAQSPDTLDPALFGFAKDLERDRAELAEELTRLANWACTTTGGAARGHNIGKARALLARIEKETP